MSYPEGADAAGLHVSVIGGEAPWCKTRRSPTGAGGVPVHSLVLGVRLKALPSHPVRAAGWSSVWAIRLVASAALDPSHRRRLPEPLWPGSGIAAGKGGRAGGSDSGTIQPAHGPGPLSRRLVSILQDIAESLASRRGQAGGGEDRENRTIPRPAMRASAPQAPTRSLGRQRPSRECVLTIGLEPTCRTLRCDGGRSGPATRPAEAG